MPRWPTRTIAERFWSKVHKTNTCWEWTAAKYGDGYGNFRFDSGHNISAPRVAWTLAVGPIPDGMFVLHHCDNPPCVRPDHLYLGTNRINMVDRSVRHRHGAWTHPERIARGERQGSARFTADDILTMRSLAKAGLTQREIGRRYGIRQGYVSNVIRRVVWKHLP